MNTANPYAPPQAAVQDVPDPTATPAGRGTRLVAVILDGLIFAAMVYIPLIIGIGMNGHPVVVNGHFNPMVISGIGSWLPTIGFIAWCWLTILFVSRNGQSITCSIRNGSCSAISRMISEKSPRSRAPRSRYGGPLCDGSKISGNSPVMVPLTEKNRRRTSPSPCASTFFRRAK